MTARVIDLDEWRAVRRQLKRAQAEDAVDQARAVNRRLIDLVGTRDGAALPSDSEAMP